LIEYSFFISNFSKEAIKVEIKDYFCTDFGHAFSVIIGNQAKWFYKIISR